MKYEIERIVIYLSIFSYLQSKGILCLVDEVQTGFGRSGTHYWAFQSYEEGTTEMTRRFFY